MSRTSFIVKVVVTILSVSLATGVANDHHRQKRFVFYPGSVLQLAVGMAIPADVPKKIIYTNYGIMINYDLPTNLSGLLPISIIEEAKALNPTMDLSTSLLLKFGMNKGCWDYLKKWSDNNSIQTGGLAYGLASIILSEIESNENLKHILLDDVSTSSDACPFV